MRSRSLTALLSTLALAAGLAVPLLVASPASAAELLVDGGFDTTYAVVPNTSPVNAHWQYFDSQFPSPFCTTVDPWCGTPEELAEDGTPPRSGTGWVWFGSSDVAGATAYVRQSVTIPAGVTTTLSYWYRNGSVDAPFDATMTVLLDSHVLRVHTEASSVQASYTQFTADLTPYADGAAHTLSFDYLNGAGSTTGSGATNNMTLDDVSLTTDSTPPDTSFTSAPAAVVKRLTVPIGFAATEGGSFSCSLDAAAFTACTSPTTLTVQPGAHTFRVAARDSSGNVDASPATVTFTAYDCPTLNKSVKKAQLHKRAVQKRLKKAKAAGDDDKVQRLEKKLKKAKKKLRAARVAYRPCRA